MKLLLKIFAVCCLAVLFIGTLASAQQETAVTTLADSLTPSGPYHTYENMTTMLQNLAANHSDIMELFSIGTTYQGRTIWAVKISDNVQQEENEPQVLFMGAHHGNEKPGTEVCLRFIQYLVDNYHASDKDPSGYSVSTLVNDTEIYVIPMVNPDGYAADQRENKEPNHGSFGHSLFVTSYGVDINRNYGYKWYRYFLTPQLYLGSTGIRDFSTEYRGPYPFSTAEASAVRSLVDSHNISIAISYHTYGEQILYPWGTPDCRHRILRPSARLGKTSPLSIATSKCSPSASTQHWVMPVTGCTGTMGSMRSRLNSGPRSNRRTPSSSRIYAQYTSA